MSEIPEGIQSAQKLSQFAAALGVSERTVRGWADRGTIKLLPTPPGRWRYVHVQELARLESEGWPVDWERLL